MPISPGFRIGPYEVTSHLGEGGMGVVYRGRDSRLQRDVALKLLLDNFASDPDRMSRFQREAQVLASLNHTHIAQIYGLESVENSACIVMEFVEGETLADRLKKGPLSHDETLDIAKQIVEALAAAHERGVVHRDLKPANIKITPDGTVKVLDFGLAKALGPKPSDMSLTAMPTVAGGSVVGAIVGTPGYMSPEQARGKDVDARTDIWAFGCVLYEMLTARQAFEGETVTDIVAKIVTSGPDLELLPKDTPQSIRLLLSSVLNKNPAQRLQHIGDARLFLDGTLIPAISAKIDGAHAKGGMGGKLAIAALLLSLAVLAVAAAVYFRKAPTDASLMRFDLVVPGNGMPALSPDGEMIAYITASDGKRSLWVRPIGADVGRQIAGTEDLSGFLWSPDSKKIAFIAQNKLQKVDLVGGSAQFLGNIGPVLGADWSRAGVILMGRAKDNIIVKIADTGGEITPITKLDEKRQETIHALPVFLPDGNHFLYVAAGSKMEEAGIFLTSLSLGEAPTRVVKLVPNRFNGMAYVAPNHLLYSSDGKLVVQSLSSDGRTVQGEPFTIVDDIDGNFTVSNNGLLTFRKTPPVTRKQLLWFSHDGKPMGQLDTDANYGNLDFSPKGDRVAVDKVTDTNRDIWVIDLQRLIPQRVTFDAGTDWSPVWSPDGSRLMFAASRSVEPGSRILEKSSTGAGEETRIEVGNTTSIPVNWSPDGQYLTYSRMRANGNGYDMWVLPLSGDRTPKPFIESTFDRIQARISPDSKYVAYSTNESGTFQIVVQTFPDPNGGKWQISGDGGVEPKWRRDGKELYYLALDGKMMAVPIPNGASFNAGKPSALFQTPLTMARNNPTRDRRYDVAPDGRFLMVVPVPGGAQLPTTVLVNWESALKK